jgi:hypothetical protein
LLTGDILRIQIAIIAACAGTFVFAHTDPAQAGYPTGQEFIGSGSRDMGPGKAPGEECFSRMNDNEKAVVVADINNYQQQMMIRNIKKGNVKTTRKR